MKKPSLISLLAVAAMIGLAIGAQSPSSSNQTSSHVMVTPEAVKWSRSGPGMEVAVLSGNPQGEGTPFVLRLKIADGTKVPAHWHPVDETLAVIAGTFYMGQGEKFDESKAHEMKVGSYGFMPKETRHFAWVKGETVIQIHGVGPFKTIWVEPRSNQ